MEKCKSCRILTEAGQSKRDLPPSTSFNSAPAGDGETEGLCNRD